MHTGHNKFLELQTSFLTVMGGALGAAVAYALALPLYPLLGPAIIVSLLNLCGMRLGISSFVRDTAFLFLGISIGSGLDLNALDALQKWPFAFFMLAIMLFLGMITGRWILTRGFAFDRQEALLATSPGHLSFVVSLGLVTTGDAARIMIIQSIRLLALTLCIPFVALASGIDPGDSILPPGETITFPLASLLILLSIVGGYVFTRINVPAAYLMSGMVVSSIGHVTELTPGIFPEPVIIPGFIILGCLIGSRFNGITLQQLRSTILAGLAVTIMISLIAGVFAAPVAWWLSIPLAHALLAFAPGGLETMIIMGAVLGAEPGFLAACHVARLFILSFLVPMMLERFNTR